MIDERIEFSEISPSEFFYRNRDLAGFTSPSRALYSAIRELFENSLDACELYSILPDVFVRVTPLDPYTTDSDPKAYSIKVQDNGPGIPPKHVPKAFGQVFFGSKFQLKQSRGMFGMGGTMAILYGQITTNKPVSITTSVDGVQAFNFDILIDIQENAPIILKKSSHPAEGSTGTTVRLSLNGDYQRASQKVREYFKQAAMVTPYANITFVDPYGRLIIYDRGSKSMPPPSKETLPHPYGMDVEALRRLIRQSKEDAMVKFISKNFHRVGDRVAQKFLDYVGFDQNRNPKSLSNDDITKFIRALHEYDNFLQPDASCLSPLGKKNLIVGIEKELGPEFVAVATRPPSAYSGFPFIVEVGLAYGGKITPPGTKLFRFANRIPLLYDEANDVSSKVINEVDWKRYKVPQNAPIAIITHICSTRIPYKTVGKEYLADRPELEKELKNALRETLRKLKLYLSKKNSIAMVKKKLNIYSKYLPLIAKFSTELSGEKRLPRYDRLLNRKQIQGDLEDNTEI
ncbi:MAG: DNA topoisomerase VI subunit B [Candidatus Methylarchaceae archaeon HK02M1]|nr:DNA topoisomerase VI subunit B [Candidatus Methylarchaceae archaeon HK02M1]